MNSPPPLRISVLIRTLDRPHELARALRSIFAQTHPALDILIYNDGGAPLAPLIDTLIAEHSPPPARRPQLIESPQRQGRAHAANALLEAAPGQALLFLDDDDWLLPEHLAALASRLQHHPTAIAAYSDVRCVRSDGHGGWHTVREFAEDYDAERLGHENFLPIHAVLFRRSAVDHGCRFPNLDAFEDWTFWLQLARLGAFVRQPAPTAIYCLDGSGFGCAPPDPAQRRAQLLAFVAAARPHWSDAQLAAMLDLYGWKVRTRELEAELDAIRNTLSWRITAPLRRLRAWLPPHRPRKST